MENKVTKMLLTIWTVLAVAAFVAGFWAPIWIKVIDIVFGSFNLLIIGSWLSALIQGRKEYKKQQMLLENKEEE